MNLRARAILSSTLSIALLCFQDKIRQNYEHLKASKNLKQKIQTQLNISSEAMETKSLEQIQKNHISNLRKETADWVRQMNQLTKDDHRMKHIKIGGIFLVGTFICPQVIIFPSLGYFMLNQITFVSFLLKGRLNKDFLPLMKIEHFYEICFQISVAMLAFGTCKTAFNKYRSYAEKKALIKK